MQVIGTKTIGDVVYPESEFPASAVKIVFDGKEYIVYEDGDELPPEPVYDEQL